MLRYRLDPDATGWYPEQRTGLSATVKLAPGQIVISERTAYRVIEIGERNQADWTDAFRDRWIEHAMPDPATWGSRPMTVTLRREQDEHAEPQHLLAPADHGWKTLPEHYSICRVCGEIPPCKQEHNEFVMAIAVEKLDTEMAITPGLCHSCLEPITDHQKSIMFEGENLIRPDLGDGTAAFHLRPDGRCRVAAERYDARWATAAEGRRRKLFCDGKARYHYDGSMDCTEGELCPGRVDHRTSESHRPGSPFGATGCWCVPGDPTERATRQIRDETAADDG